MKKLLISGVSVFAIVAATNALAAGYTCEDLIEYTSCNPGYVLSGTDCVKTCDAGYYLNGDTCSICPVGSYSLAGATTCSTCPATGLTDKDGKTVVATTASTGSTTASACYVGSDVYFADDMGIYHFTSNCEYSGTQPGISGGGSTFMTEQAACEADEDGTWNGSSCDCGDTDVFVYSEEIGVGVCTFTSFQDAETIVQDCANNGGTWDYAAGSCSCPSGTTWEMDGMAYGDEAYCDATTLNTESTCTAAGGYFEEFDGTIACMCEGGSGWAKDTNGNYICEK